ncbi:hypothetical protein D3C87_951620 [compost metagenome]
MSSVVNVSDDEPVEFSQCVSPSNVGFCFGNHLVTTQIGVDGELGSVQIRGQRRRDSRGRSKEQVGETVDEVAFQIFIPVLHQAIQLGGTRASKEPSYQRRTEDQCASHWSSQGSPDSSEGCHRNPADGGSSNLTNT